MIVHHKLAKAISRQSIKERSLIEVKQTQEYGKILRHIRKTLETTNVLLSSEGFSNSHPRTLSRLFKFTNPVVAVYVREQVSYLLSGYAQLIQSSNNAMTLEEYEQDHFRGADYDRFLNLWQAHFPDGDLVVRNYDRQYLTNRDIVEDFLVNVMGIRTTTHFDKAVPTRNPSIAGKLLEAKRLANEKGDLAHLPNSLVYGALGQLALDSRYEVKATISSEMLERLEARFIATNEKVNAAFLPDTPLVLNSELVSDDANTELSDTEYGAILEDIVNAVETLSKSGATA